MEEEIIMLIKEFERISNKGWIKSISKSFGSIELLEKDIIKVSLISRMNKSGIDAGRYRNKNLVFQIDKNKIEMLFKKIKSCNSDY